MRTNLEVNENYAEAIREINLLRLLIFIKEVSYRYKEHKHVAHSLYKYQFQLSILYQGKNVAD